MARRGILDPRPSVHPAAPPAAERCDHDFIARLLCAVPGMAIVVDAEDRVAAFNEAAQSLLPSLANGSAVASHLRSPDILDAVSSVRSSRAATRTYWLERAPVERFFEVSVAPLEASDRSIMVVVSLHEISETRRFERTRNDFIANASHELRTPLASLIGFIETLQGPARNDEGARETFLGIMRDQAHRMARLVDDLLCLSRIEQHQHLRPNARVDLASVVLHIADTLEPLAAERGVQLCAEVDGPVFVPGDHDELLRVVENLVENAIKYGAADALDRRVLITLKPGAGEASFSVRDFGIGIAAEHIPRLTERFYRVDAGASRAKGGTGLGLALVKHVVARHRGRLSIESRQGQGASFQVILPLFPTGARAGHEPPTTS